MALAVVLAEDSYLMRQGVSRLLETDDAVRLVATAADLESLRVAVEAHTPEVVVTDIRMPPTNTDEGIQAAAAFRETHPRLGVVVLSQYDEPEYALRLVGHVGGPVLPTPPVLSFLAARPPGSSSQTASEGGYIVRPRHRSGGLPAGEAARVT